MEIKYELISFDESYGTVVVKYYTDEFSEGFIYNIDIPIEDNKFAPKEQIEALIKLHEPKAQIQRIISLRKEQISLPEEIKSLVKQNNVAIDVTLDKAESVRAIRNELLNASDYTQLLDVPLPEIEKKAWAAYRQELRDITKQAGFPETIVYPLSPIGEPR